MVFHGGDNDLFPFFKEGGKPFCNQIDSVGGSGRKNDFLVLLGIKMRTKGFAGLLIQVGRLLRQGMHSAMDVGIVVLVIIRDHLYHLSWGLGSCCVVEINQGMSIYFP